MTDQTKPRWLWDYFDRLERLIAAQYSLSPSRHKSDKGEDREDFLVRVFNNHLPAIARAYRGGVILDNWDNMSSQTDIVVYSVFSPMIHHNKKPVFLAEGAFAAVEVKSVLDTKALISAFEWSTRIKHLEKLSVSTRGKVIGVADTVPSICTGLFAYTSRISKPATIIKRALAYHKQGTPNYKMIDFICVNGEFCICRERTESVAAIYSPKGTTLEEYQRECKFEVSSVSVGRMFSLIAEYISYIGPIPSDLTDYLYAKTNGDGREAGC